MKALMVLTSHDVLGDTGRRTGLWLEELAAPYYVFVDAGWEVTMASPLGGRVPLDPKSYEPDAHTQQTRRFEADETAKQQLATTVRLDSVHGEHFDAVFYPGGHGPLWDLVEDPTSQALIAEALMANQPLAFVCHAPAALVNVTLADGQPAVSGRRVTGFSNTEEEAVHLTDVVPFLLEDELERRGGQYSKGGDFEAYIVEDGALITGQNPASSGPAAAALLKLVQSRAASA
jgi:putative intracellular protease/amidase